MPERRRMRVLREIRTRSPLKHPDGDYGVNHHRGTESRCRSAFARLKADRVRSRANADQLILPNSHAAKDNVNTWIEDTVNLFNTLPP